MLQQHRRVFEGLQVASCRLSVFYWPLTDNQQPATDNHQRHSASKAAARKMASRTPGTRASRSSRRSEVRLFVPSMRVWMIPASRNTRMWCDMVDLATSTSKLPHGSSVQFVARQRTTQSRTGSLKAWSTLARQISFRVGC